MVNESIGLAIRDLRTKKNLTLNELSRQTGLSISYLSLLERGQCNPTISSVQTLCKALNITMTSLLININSRGDLIVRKEDRKVLFKSNSGVIYESLTDEKPLSGVCMTVKTNHHNISDPHIADEFGYIVSGSLLLNINGNDYILNAGDSIYIPANTHHSFQKLSEEDCVSIWTYASCD